MKYCFFIKENREDLLKLKNNMLELISSSFVLDEINPEVVIILGGDGTLLKAIQHYIDIVDKIKFVTFKLGKVSFFANFEIDDYQNINEILSSNKIISYSLLEVQYNNISKFALNEFTFTKENRAVELSVFIDNEKLETYEGSGLLISTTMGSSAYNRSINGAMIDHNLDAIEISELAPYTSNMNYSLKSSLILSPDRKITIVNNVSGELIMNFDNSKEILTDVKSIDISLNRKINLIIKDDFSYINKIRKTFIK